MSNGLGYARIQVKKFLTKIDLLLEFKSLSTHFAFLQNILNF
jgi:hypothetical protein